MSANGIEVSKINEKRLQNKQALAKQKKQRVGQKADGNIHAVSRDVVPSRVREAADITDLGLPTVKRYVRASSLPGIDPPPGYTLKWVRCDNRARGDGANLAQHMREGWVIATMKMFPKQNLPTSQLTNHGQVIGNGDTILMIATVEMVASRNAEIRSKTDRATRGVLEDSGLKKVVSPQMPLVEDIQRSKTQFRRERRTVQPANDEADADE